MYVTQDLPWTENERETMFSLFKFLIVSEVANTLGLKMFGPLGLFMK